jgi:hypothetical protein
LSTQPEEVVAILQTSFPDIEVGAVLEILCHSFGGLQEPAAVGVMPQFRP